MTVNGTRLALDFDRITDNLYVGAQFGPGEWKKLAKLGIIVN